MADLAKVKIEKLNNDNYQTWKYEAELILRRENTWFSVTTPAPAKTDASYNNWVIADSKAIGTIGLLVEKGQHVHTRPAKSAKEAWDNLREHHEKASLSSTVHMYVKLASMKLPEDGDIEVLLQEVEFIIDKLIAVGEPITDRFRIGMMLGNLPSSYGTLITALECRAEKDLTVGMIREKILGEYKRRKESDNTLIVPKQESVMKIQKGDSEKTKYKTKATCHFCKKPGHFKAKCFKYKAQLKKEKEHEGQQAAKIATKTNFEDQDEDRGGMHFCFVGRISNIQTNPWPNKEVNLKDFSLTESETLCFKIQEENKDKWYVDSAASCHMTNSMEHFETFEEKVLETVRVADGNTTMTAGIGNLILDCEKPEGGTNSVLVTKVRYVPELDSNLLSVRSLTKMGMNVNFCNNKCVISKGDTVVATADAVNGLYKLNCTQRAMLTFFEKNDCLHTWHRRFGHRDPESIKLLESEFLATGIHIGNCHQTIFCDTCMKGKMARLPFPKKSTTKTMATLDLVHSDLCGPMQTQTVGGKRYFLTLIDDYSRYCTVYLLAKKSEAADKIQHFVQNCSNKFGRKPIVIRSDLGGEYLSNKLQSFFKANGIEHQTTAAYSPQQNGVAERKNRSLTEMGRCMLIDAGMPHKYWGEAIMTANHLQNRLPTRAIKKTPYEVWFGKKPDLKYIHIFGCKAFMHIPDMLRRKLDDKAMELTFVGYADGQKAYRLLDVKTGRVYISRDVKFVETCNNHQTSQMMEPAKLHEKDTQCRGNSRKNEYYEVNMLLDSVPYEAKENNAEPTTRTSSRSTKGIPPQRLIESCNQTKVVADEPRNFKEAMAGPDKQKWEEAMQEEMNSFHENKVWELTHLPNGRKAIGGKWVFKRKTDELGNISRYKARYVAQGFSQIYGEDYDEVFAPVAKQTTLRTLLTVAGKQRMVVKHFDIKTAFLNGDLENELYMKQPEGYVTEGKEHLVCKLKKSIYGLKQSARMWNKKIHTELTRYGFERSKHDQCLYFKEDNRLWIYIIIHVDDIIMASHNETLINNTEQRLSKIFNLCCLGNLKFYLGIQFDRASDGTFFIHQRAYNERIIQRFGMQEAKPSKIPLDPGYEKRNEVHAALKDNVQYRSAVGALLYVSTCTRPDIAVATSILSRKISNPNEADWEEVKRVFRYLKYTLDFKLKLGSRDEGNYQEPLIGYADANWAGNVTDRKSNSGYLFKLFVSSISWASRKQQCVSLSSTEAEYVSLSEACQEGVWISRLLSDFQIMNSTPFVMFEDNQSCLKLLDCEKVSNRTKHIDTRYHFAKNLKVTGQAIFKYCPTEEMVADILTKPLEAVKTRKLTSLLGLG